MNVVVVGTHRLADEADFPMLNLAKFGWEQYPELEQQEIAERCWRADIIVSIDTPVDRAVIDKAFKLKLIVAVGTGHDFVDTSALAERGITLCHLPALDPTDKTVASAICNGTVETINSYLADNTINRIG